LGECAILTRLALPPPKGLRMSSHCVGTFPWYPTTASQAVEVVRGLLASKRKTPVRTSHAKPSSYEDHFWQDASYRAPAGVPKWREHLVVFQRTLFSALVIANAIKPETSFCIGTILRSYLTKLHERQMGRMVMLLLCLCGFCVWSNFMRKRMEDLPRLGGRAWVPGEGTHAV
jgi:hypothetical protein